jgi:hypothetical protein
MARCDPPDAIFVGNDRWPSSWTPKNSGFAHPADVSSSAMMTCRSPLGGLRPDHQTPAREPHGRGHCRDNPRQIEDPARPFRKSKSTDRSSRGSARIPKRMDAMKGFSNRWKDFLTISSVTKRFGGGDRGVGTLHRYYAKDIVVHARQWASSAATNGSSPRNGHHRRISDRPSSLARRRDLVGDMRRAAVSTGSTVAAHTRDGAFGNATGKRWNVKVIADCAALRDTSSMNGSCAITAAWCGNSASHPEPAPPSSHEGGAANAKRPFTDQDLSTAATTGAAV